MTVNCIFVKIEYIRQSIFLRALDLVYVLKLKCCFTSTETVGLLGTGAQDAHLDFHTAPEFWGWRTGKDI